ncbi:MAG: hypothetical protein LBK66_03145 [Spirochaetaceae bacterium]|jgi:hypothetical protein|nr:hypothetical protein [Spirochaetaceae bacterium]
MTIDAKFIAKYSRICERLKDDSQPIYDSGLLDFEHGNMIFGSQKGFGQIKMDVEGWDGRQKPFFVNLNSFLNVVKEFPVLELEGFKFKHGTDDVFEISHLEDDTRFPDFINSGNAASVKIDASALAAIKKCGLFVDVDGSASLNGVFVKNGNVWGTNKNRLCEEYVDSLAGADLPLPRIVWETLVMDILGEDLVIDKDNASFFISSGDEIKIQFAVNSALSSPDIHNPNFVNKFDHPNYITLDKDGFLGVVNFIQPFVLSSASQRIQLIVGDTLLEIKSEDNGNIISRKIPIIEKGGSIETDSKIWASANWIKTILGVVGGKTVKIQIDLGKPAVNISSVEEPSVHVVYCRLTEVV